jgi:hypothetical protein
MMMRPQAALASAFLISLAGRAVAQANPDSIKHRNDCRLVAQVLTTGHPAPKTDWAFTIVGNCGDEGIQALSAGILSMKSSLDTGILAGLSQQARYYHDGSIFASALTVAGDPSASIPARIYSLLTLQYIILPSSSNTYAEATSDIDANGWPVCTRIIREQSGARVRPGITPLPADYEAQAQALTRQLRADASTPALVRAAASCPM